jgi:WD40 repeat protein
MRWGLGLFAIAAWSIAAGSTAHCEDKRVLMLNTGGHHAEISGVTFAADGNYVVSAGFDKVVRVWDWRAGRTIRIIRGQVGQIGKEGRIEAMALSPDDRWLAVGGWMAPGDGVRDEDVGDIRLFDFASGELKAVLKGHRKEVLALAFSYDSRQLISGSGDNTAIIWDVEGRKPLYPALPGRAADSSKELTVAHVGLTRDGRAVTASFDTLRVWNVADGLLIKEIPAKAQILALAVSPKDGTIASEDANGEIHLWDGTTGEARVSRLAKQPPNNIFTLTFSPDGRMLLASSGAVASVLDVASGKVLSTYSHDNTIYASAFWQAPTPPPDAPREDAKDGPQQLVATSGGDNKEIDIWDPRTAARKGALKGTGSTVHTVAFSTDGQQFAWGDRALQMAFRLPIPGELLGDPEPVTNQEGWVRAQTTHDNWSFDSSAPAILQDGKVQAKLPGPVARSHTFTPDGETVIVGQAGVQGGSRLTAYRRDGSMIGDFTGHEFVVHSLAVSPDGNYLVSGSADQTIRLWDVKTRHLLFTLFYGQDKRWIVWTPQGYFKASASPDGEGLIGWQVNNGANNSADFFPAYKFRDQFFRPDILGHVVNNGDESAGITQANRIMDLAAAGNSAVDRKGFENLTDRLPPIVGIDELSQISSDQAKIKYTLRSPSGLPVTNVTVRVNNDVITSSSANQPLTKTSSISDEVTITIPEAGGVTIEISAEATSKNGQTLIGSAQLPLRTGSSEPDSQPTLYALIVGIHHYGDFNPANRDLDIKSDETDASDFYAELKKQVGPQGAFKKIEVWPDGPNVLLDAAATKANIQKGLEWLVKQSRTHNNDIFLFYFSGHGMSTQGRSSSFLVPVDVDQDQIHTFLSSHELYLLVGAIKGISVVFLDACRAADGFGQLQTFLKFYPEGYLKDAPQSSLIYAFAASLAGKDAYNSFFTKALINGLDGAAADPPTKHEISPFDLENYLHKNLYQFSQHMQDAAFQMANWNEKVYRTTVLARAHPP